MFPKSNLPKKDASAGHSDRTLMVTVQDLINAALGPPEGNKVNFKLIQKILHILAHQMRIQEQFVDLGYEESQISITSGGSNKQSTGHYGQNLQAKEKDISDIDKQREGHKTEREKAKHYNKIEKIESERSKEKKLEGIENAELAKITDKERAEYERQKSKKQDMAGNEEAAKLVKITDKEGSEHEYHESNESDVEKKENAKLANITVKERAEYESQKAKERDIEEKENPKLPKIMEKENAEYESEKAKERDIERKEKVNHAKTDDTEMGDYKIQKAKEPVIAEKVKLYKIMKKERAEYASHKANERDLEEKEQARLAKMTDEEAKYEKDKAKELGFEEKEKTKISEKERVEYESHKAKEQDFEEKEQAKLAEMTDEEAEYEKDNAKKQGFEEKDKLAKITGIERAESESQKTKEQDVQENENFKEAKMSDKEKAAHGSQKAGERDMEEKAELEKITYNERAEYESEKTKEQDVPENAKVAKERAEYETQKTKERDIKEKEEAMLAKMTNKESPEYESQKAKEREIEEAEKAKLAKITDKDKAEYESQKAKERDIEVKEKAKLADKERAEYESQKAKERDIEVKEKAKLADKERAEYESQKAKERDIEVKEKAKLADKETAEYESQKAKERDIEVKEKAKLADKERAEYESQKAKERDIEVKEKAKLADKERAEYESQKAKERDIEIKEKAKLADKERAEYESQKAKERDIEIKEKAKLADKERAEYESQKAKERDIEEKEKAMLAKITDTESAKYGSQKAKERDIEEKEKSKLAKSTDKERAEYEIQKAKERDVEETAKLAEMTDREIALYELQKAKERVMEEKKMANLGKMSDKVSAEYESYKAKEEAMEEKKQKIADKKKNRGTSVSDSQPRVGSIEVVTRSEFNLLEERVEDLEERVAPIPYPLLPFKLNLRKELSVGSISLTDSMQGLQMMARVEAAEEAVGRMADVLTMLLVESGVSKEEAGKVKSATAGINGAYDELTGVETVLNGQEPSKVVVSKNIQKGSRSRSRDLQGYQSRSNVQEYSQIQLPIAQRSSYQEADSDKPTEREEVRVSLKLSDAVVTHADLNYAVGFLKDEMIKNADAMTSTAQKTAETAHYTVQNLVDLTTMLSDIDTRMNKLQLLIDDYAQVLASFDTAGIDDQMASFYAQLQSTQSELEAGITLFEKTFNKETEDVKDLKARFDEIVKVLELTTWSHKQLTAYQSELDVELARLHQFVEKLQEDKVDMEMVLDGQRDKADRSELEGLLYVTDFNISRAGMERTLLMFQQKFDLQDHVWMHALEELKDIAILKADIRMLLNHKAEFEEQLMQVQQGLNMVAKAVGGPKAALLIRQLKEGGLCGACSIDAVPQAEVDYTLPPRLPALRRHFPTTEAVCEMPGPPPPPPLEERQHFCRRWVGGSHTKLSDSVVRTEAPTPAHPPTKKYTGFGDDGKLYKMAETLAPCSECNQSEDIKGIVVDGAGDTGVSKTFG